MGRIVVSQFITVDGVVEDPGGAEPFARGGWAFQYDRGAEGDSFKLDEVMAAEALLLGRTTFDGFAQAWPEREGSFADKFNTMPKYVVSSTLRDPSWSNSTVIGIDGLEQVKRDVAGEILVNGSVRLVGALVERDLVDEYRLMVFPTVLGEGKKLFDGTPEPRSLKLVDSRPAGETLILTYEPKR